MSNYKLKNMTGNIMANEDLLSFVSSFSFSNLNNNKEYYLLPGFIDVHVHFREPGFFYKETIETGSKAAAHGGYTAVCTMPNLNPVPDGLEHLKIQQDLIDQNSVIHIYPYASITKNEVGEVLSDMEALAPKVIGFSDDGRGVQSEEMMRLAMIEAKKFDQIIVAHCEVNSLLNGGYIHDGVYAKAHNHKGICSASEYLEVMRDIKLSKETGCKLHICHISTKESVEAVRKAKLEGVDVTCETAPHYLILDENDLEEDGRWKMNPPLRAKEDKLALIEGIMDGTIDMIATDHAPHTMEEKSKGLKDSPFGIVGIEIAFQLMYTHFVKTNKMSLEHLLKLMVVNPHERFHIPYDGFSIWDLDEEFIVDPNEFLSKGKVTPFIGSKLNGVNYYTVSKGKIAYQKK